MKHQSRRMKARRTRRLRKLTAYALGALLALVVAGLILWLVSGGTSKVDLRNYPVEFEDLVRRYAAENDIPPAYVASVILAESSYRPDVVSSANAQGLMQLLPSTAEWIAGKFDETYAEGCLFDPETNIRYGCWYLGFLMKRYGGDMRLSSAAYHAGQGTVDKWLKDPEYSPDGATLAAIPYSTTETYVERVLHNYEIYEKLYAQAA